MKKNYYTKYFRVGNKDIFFIIKTNKDSNLKELYIKNKKFCKEERIKWLACFDLDKEHKAKEYYEFLKELNKDDERNAAYKWLEKHDYMYASIEAWFKE